MVVALAILSGSVPYNWMLLGVSPSAKPLNLSVLECPSNNPRAVIISLTYKPAPNFLHNVRNGALVTPAIGAKMTGGQTSIVPILGFSNSLGFAVFTSRLISLLKPIYKA